MPSEKSRYTVTIDPEQSVILERYASVLGMRPSAVIKNLIEQAMDNLEGNITVLEHLSSAYNGAIDDSANRMKAGLLGALESLNDQGEGFLSSVQDFAKDYESGSFISGDGRVAAAEGGDNTLAINKGNKGNKGVRLDENLSVGTKKSKPSKKPYIFQAVDNTKKGSE